MNPKKSLFILSVLFLTGFFYTHAQKATLSGTISDTLNTPLQNANILATPASQDAQIKLSTTIDLGVYKLKLKTYL